MSKNILFITEALFKERTGASNAIDGKQIFPMIKVAQDIFIQPITGSTLYKRLQTGIDLDNLSADEKTLLDDYITDALIWYTMSMLPMVMGFQLFSKGFLQKTAEESSTPSRGDLELIEQKYKSMAEFYNTRLISFLQENHFKYTQYLNYTMGVDVIFPEDKSYSCPIYLGGADRGFTRNFSSSSTTPSPNVATYVATGGQTSFTIAAMSGRVTYFAARGGLSKSITTTPTADTQYLQITSGLVTLPTGDVALAGEVFTFLYT